MATPELRELRDRRRTIVLPTPPMENGDDAENRTAIMIVGNPNVMTRGREFPAYSSVRRQLFVEGSAAEVPEKVKKELVNKITKNEYVIQNLNDEIIAKGMKWNFNFLTETPIDGRIKWYRKSNADEWVGMKPSGRTIYMRNKKKGAAYKSVYADERSKKNERRLPPHTVERRRSFFTMAKAFDYAMAESADDNFMNTLQDVTPPIYSEGIHWNFDCINTVPLPGPVHWHQAGDCWVGHRPGLPNTIFIHRPHSLPQLRAHSPPVTKRCTRHSAARQRTGASAVPRTKASAVKRTAPAKINHASIISSSDNGQASNKKGKKASKKEKAEDFEGIEDKTENEVKVSSEVSKASNNNVDENRKSKNMKTVAIAEIANDGNHNDDELLTKTSFEKLKISDNIETEKKQDSIEKITVMKNKNEAPPKSNGPMYPDMLNAPRKAMKRRLFYR